MELPGGFSRTSRGDCLRVIIAGIRVGDLISFMIPSNLASGDMGVGRRSEGMVASFHDFTTFTDSLNGLLLL
jgi:hypothetical protein